MKYLPTLTGSLLIASLACVAPVQAADTTVGLSSRIVGGQVSTRGKWPWMVALVYKHTNAFDGQFCGATLIAPTWVVTAAHCVLGESRSTFDVVGDIFNLRTDPVTRIGIKRIFRHPQYDRYTDANDIALIQLSTAINNVAPLPLVQGTNRFVSDNAVILGWGTLSEDGYFPTRLNEATLPVVSNTTCRQAYGDAITPRILCAGLAEGGKDTCQGDSGGPLVVRQDGEWRLAGVTSIGFGCGRPGYYGLYTRVSAYLGYINDIMSANFTALADVNRDGVVTVQDQDSRYAAVQGELQSWQEQCWSLGAACADVNGDGKVTQADYRHKRTEVLDGYRAWVQEVWQPEVQ